MRVEEPIGGIGRLARKVELRREYRLVWRLYLDVQVACPSRVEPWHHSFQSIVSCCIRELMAAQLRASVVVAPPGIRLPEVQQGTGNRPAVRRQNGPNHNDFRAGDARFQQRGTLR